MIFVNLYDAQAQVGAGGRGGGGFYEYEDGSWISDPPENGKAGGIVYDAQGIDTDIYLSGATPSAAYPTADGYIRAPSGGDGGYVANLLEPPGGSTGGDGGNAGDGRGSGIAGAGRDAGIGGAGGVADYSPTKNYGDNGINGSIDGSGSGWGNAGANNDATGGAAGSGVVNNDATVVLYGADASRYINGNGDH